MNKIQRKSIQRQNIQRLFAPKSVAFIGGSSAALAAEQCVNGDFKGPIWGVNPKRKELAGQPCYPSIADLPCAPDAVFLAVPASVAVETVAQLNERGTGGVVCYTAGFSELGEEGAALERKLIEAAGDMAFVGPNCSGILNFIKDAALWPFDHGGQSADKGVAIISQSGMLGNSISMNQRSLPMAYIISSGNQGQLSVEDFLDVLIDDPCVNAVGLYIEGLRDIPAFAAVAARALQVGLPIVAHKAGTSEIGAQLTVTHTGSLSGTDDLYDALFKRLGIIRVQSAVEMLETLKLLTIAGAPKGMRVAGLTCSGGDSTMLADGGEPLGLLFPQPSPTVAAELTELLPPIATVNNPLDYTTPLWGYEEEVKAVNKALFKEGYDSAILVQDYPVSVGGDSFAPYLADLRAFTAATREAGIPGVVCSIMPENLDHEVREIMIDAGIAPMQGITDALKALARSAEFGVLHQSIQQAGSIDHLALLPLPLALPPSSEMGKVLDEWEGKQTLADFGLPVPDGRLVTAEHAAQAGQEIGFPVVVKLVSSDLPHKTEAGAVKIGLNDKADVDQAITEITKSVTAYAPHISINKFLVEKMADTPVAELIVGIRRDPAFGLCMVIGSGGILVELVADSVTLLLPTNPQSISHAINSLKASKLLKGFRGGPVADSDAIIATIMALSEFAKAHTETLIEMDINPLMAMENNALIADALISFS